MASRPSIAVNNHLSRSFQRVTSQVTSQSTFGQTCQPTLRLKAWLDSTQGLRYHDALPTLIREDGFEVRIYTLDHPPPHVHVAKAGAVIKIDLGTHHAIEIIGAISDRDVKRAEQLVARHAQF